MDDAIQTANKNVVGKVFIVIAMIALIFISLPIIICGSFINPLVPIIAIVGLIFALRGLSKLLKK